MEELVRCVGCGRDDAAPGGVVPLGWSEDRGPDRCEHLCPSCTRVHARSIEARLDRDWW